MLQSRQVPAMLTNKMVTTTIETITESVFYLFWLSELLFRSYQHLSPRLKQQLGKKWLKDGAS